MKRIALLSALLLCMSSPAFAKFKVSVSVYVKNDDELLQELTRKIRARLNSTERYTVVDTFVGNTFFIDVNCLVLKNEGGYKTGVVCYSTVSFYPFENSGLTSDLPNARAMVVGDTGYIAETLIDNFINGTTDDQLEVSKKILQIVVRAHCTNNPNECTPVQK